MADLFVRHLFGGGNNNNDGGDSSSGDSSSGGSSSSTHICPIQSLTEIADQPLVNNMSFHTFNEIFSGACTAFACVVILVFMLTHATHLSLPNEQIKIMRISLLLPFYAVLSLLGLSFPTAQVYIFPWLDVVQSIAIGSFFLLLCEFVSPSTSSRDGFFAGLTVKTKKNKKSPSGTMDGLSWFRTRWFMVFQYPVVSLVTAILSDVTQAAGVYCQFISKPYFARLWLNLATKASLVIAVMSVFAFYRQTKKELAEHKPLRKFFAFKIVVGLTFIENIIFWILRDTNSLNPTATLTWADINIGIPGMLVCVEMVPLSLFFVYAYWYRPYVPGSKYALRPVVSAEDGSSGMPMSYHGGASGLVAFLQAWNPMEVVQAVIFGFRNQAERRFGS